MGRDAFDREPAGSDPVASRSQDQIRHQVPGRDVSYPLSGDDLRTLRTVATFRTVDVRDVAEKQTGNLIRHGLVERKTVQSGRQKQALRVLIATDAGKRLLEAGRPLEDLRRFHAGLVKPNELAHDAAIYPAYLEQASQIEAAGGKVRRVVLDYELKSVVNRQMNRKDGPAPREDARKSPGIWTSGSSMKSYLYRISGSNIPTNRATSGTSMSRLAEYRRTITG